MISQNTACETRPPMTDRPKGERPGGETVRATEEVRARARTPEELVACFSTPVWRFVSSQISRREEAEDIVMEVFAAAFGHFGQLERADDQRLWLLAVARNKVANSLRRHYRRAERPYSEAAEATDTLAVSDIQMATRSALETLPADQRQVLVLKYVNGLSTDEVAHVIRRSPQATNSLLQRGRESLRQALGSAVLDSFKDPS